MTNSDEFRIEIPIELQDLTGPGAAAAQRNLDAIIEKGRKARESLTKDERAIFASFESMSRRAGRMLNQDYGRMVNTQQREGLASERRRQRQRETYMAQMDRKFDAWQEREMANAERNMERQGQRELRDRAMSYQRQQRTQEQTRARQNARLERSAAAAISNADKVSMRLFGSVPGFAPEVGRRVPYVANRGGFGGVLRARMAANGSLGGGGSQPPGGIPNFGFGQQGDSDFNSFVNQKKNEIRALDKELSSLTKKRSADTKTLADAATGWGKSISNAFKSIGSAAGNLLSIPGKLAYFFTSWRFLVLGGAAVGGVAAMVAWPLELADNMTKAEISMTRMLGTAKRAKGFMSDIQKFAIETPFETPQLVEESKFLLTQHWQPKDVIPDLRAIGDAVSNMGGNLDNIHAITNALAQMKNAGRLNAQDMLQLTNQDIQAWDYLAAAAGTSVEKIRKSAENNALPFSSKDAVAIIIAGMRRNFSGSMQETANKTVGGLWSQIWDTFTQKIATKWGKGIQTGLIPGMQTLLDDINANQDAISAWGDELGVIGQQLAGGFSGALKTAADRLQKLTSSTDWQSATGSQKRTMFWKTMIEDPMDDWWKESGQSMANNLARNIGNVLGGATGGIVSYVVGGNASDSGNAWTQAGVQMGGNFMAGFAQSFNLGEILKSAVTNWGSDEYIRKHVQEDPVWSHIIPQAALDNPPHVTMPDFNPAPPSATPVSPGWSIPGMPDFGPSGTTGGTSYRRQSSSAMQILAAMSLANSPSVRSGTWGPSSAQPVNYHPGGGRSAGSGPISGLPTVGGGYAAMVRQTAARFGLPQGTLEALINNEDPSYDPSARGYDSEIGLTQVLPDTLRGMGYDPDAVLRSPGMQVEAGAKYLKQQYDRFGRWDLAYAAYNAGPGAVEKYGGVPPFAQGYVDKIQKQFGGASLGATISVNVGGITVELHPENLGNLDEKSVGQLAARLADEVADRIAAKVEQVTANMV